MFYYFSVIKDFPVILFVGINVHVFIASMLNAAGITIITVVTCDDRIRPNQRDEVIRKAREATLSIKRNTFLVANWLSNQDQYDITYENAVVNMLHTALSCGERSIKMRQSKRVSSRPRRATGAAENEDDSGVDSLNSF